MGNRIVGGTVQDVQPLKPKSGVFVPDLTLVAMYQNTAG
jgi:hypothetical protein